MDFYATVFAVAYTVFALFVLVISGTIKVPGLH